MCLSPSICGYSTYLLLLFPPSYSIPLQLSSFSIPKTAPFPFLFNSYWSSFPLPVLFTQQLIFPSCSISPSALFLSLFCSHNSSFPLPVPFQRQLFHYSFFHSCYFHNSAFPLAPVLLPLQCSFLNNISFNTSHAISSSAHLYQKI